MSEAFIQGDDNLAVLKHASEGSNRGSAKGGKMNKKVADESKEVVREISKEILNLSKQQDHETSVDM